MHAWNNILWMVCLCFVSFTQEITWLKPEEVKNAFRNENRPIILFFYADWCSYCKLQEETVFKNPSISEHLNQTFYAVKIDVETKDTIFFLDRVYTMDGKTNRHELVNFFALSENKLQLPTTTFISADLSTIRIENKYLSTSFWLDRQNKK